MYYQRCREVLEVLGPNCIPCHGFILHVNFTKFFIKLVHGHILRAYFHLKFQLVIIFSIIIITELNKVAVVNDNFYDGV